MLTRVVALGERKVQPVHSCMLCLIATPNLQHNMQNYAGKGILVVGVCPVRSLQAQLIDST